MPLRGGQARAGGEIPNRTSVHRIQDGVRPSAFLAVAVQADLLTTGYTGRYVTISVSLHPIFSTYIMCSCAGGKFSHPHTGLFFPKVADTGCDVLWFILKMRFMGSLFLLFNPFKHEWKNTDFLLSSPAFPSEQNVAKFLVFSRLPGSARLSFR
jgi:hypothetical protein